MRPQLAEIEKQSADPNLWNDPKKSQQVMREKKRLEDMLSNEAELTRRSDDISAYFDLSREGENVDADIRRELDALRQFVDRLETESLLSGNEILMARTQGIGIVSRELAINAGITGPLLRASGVNYDLRKVDKYGIYDRFSFRIPLGDHGDVYDRYMIRLLEMRESISILKQAMRDIPEGPFTDPKTKVRNFRPKPGEAYGRIEAPKGELGFYVISDGTPNPYRYRVRPPSLINLTVLEDMCLGHNVADNRQAQAGAAILGREIRQEQLFLIVARDAASRRPCRCPCA